MDVTSNPDAAGLVLEAGENREVRVRIESIDGSEGVDLLELEESQ